jgi:hypothetical protein
MGLLESGSPKVVNVAVANGGYVAHPKTLRAALDEIERMLTNQPYSADLWDVLSAIRGPDSRNRKLKHATTTIIRSAAFPKRPCEERSFYGEDSAKRAEIRKRLFHSREDFNHFRQHVKAAFDALGLDLEGINGLQRNPHRSDR